MAPIAARRAAFAATAADVVAVDLRGIAPAPALRPVYEAVRARVPVMVRDRVVADDIAAVAETMAAIDVDALADD